MQTLRFRFVRILRDFLFSSSFAPPKFSFCFRAVMETRLAWDGECYTRSDFLEWYGEDQGFVIRGKVARAKDVVASAKDVTISFNLLSGRKACQDLVLTHTYISARGVRDHLRKYSEHDAVRILDWHSKLFIRGAPLDLDCTNIFELESTESMMASGTFHVNVTVIRKPLWDDEPQGQRD